MTIAESRILRGRDHAITHLVHPRIELQGSLTTRWDYTRAPSHTYRFTNTGNLFTHGMDHTWHIVELTGNDNIFGGTIRAGSTANYLRFTAGTPSVGTGPVLFLNGGGVMFYTSDIMYNSARWTLQGAGTFMHINRAPVVIGSLEGVGVVRFGDRHTPPTDLRLITGADNTDAEFHGPIYEFPTRGPGHVEKIGTGSWTLYGPSTYHGDTIVSNGTLIVHGVLENTAHAHVRGAPASPPVLGGRGTIGGDVTVEGGILLGGTADQAGTLSIGGNLSLDADATLAVRIAGAADFSRVEVAGDVTLAGALRLSFPDGVAKPVGEALVILAAAGDIAGDFDSVPDGSRVTVANQQVVLEFPPLGSILLIR